MFTVFSLALGFLAGLGSIACGVGVLATYPLFFLGHALAYRDLVGVPGASAHGQFSAPPPPPDYRNYAPTPTPDAQQQQWGTPSYGAPAPSESATKACPHCGAALARAVNFCNQCGRSLR
jgi:hypothetical protein